MRYVFYAFACVAALMAWVQTSDKGHSIKRHFAEQPVDPSWSR